MILRSTTIRRRAEKRAVLRLICREAVIANRKNRVKSRGRGRPRNGRAPNERKRAQNHGLAALGRAVGAVVASPALQRGEDAGL